MSNFLDSELNSLTNSVSKSLDDLVSGKDGKVVNSVESYIGSLGSRNIHPSTTPNIGKVGTESLINDYAIINYGSAFVNGSQLRINNIYYGENGVPNQDEGFLSSYDQWSNPTTFNIIEWSKQFSDLASLQKQTNDRQNKDAKDMFSNGQNIDTLRKKGFIQQSIDGNGNSGLFSFGGGDTFVEKGGGLTDVVSVDGQNKTVNNQTGFASSASAGKEIIGQSNKNAESINNKLREEVPTVGNLKYAWKDFAFVKNYNRFPNNHLITLRRFKLPVLDSGAVAYKEQIKKQLQQFNKSDLSLDSARALTYFGEGTSNDLTQLLSFTTQLNWGDLTFGGTDSDGEIQKVTGSEGWFNSVGTQATEVDVSKVINPVTGNTIPSLQEGTMAHDLFMFSNFMNVSNKTGGLVKDFFSYNLYKNPDADPYSSTGAYRHRVFGPVNVITKTKVRKRGIEFSGQGLKIVFEYDLQSLEGVNPKMAMLDVLSNMQALVYNNAPFFGGDVRFMTSIVDAPIDSRLADLLQAYNAGQTAEASVGDTVNALKQSVSVSLVDGLQSAIDIGKNIANNAKSNMNNDPQLQAVLASIVSNVNSASDTIKKTNKMGINDDTGELIKSTFTNLVTALGKAGDDIITSAGTPIQQQQFRAAINFFGMKLGKSYKNAFDGIIKLNPIITGEPVGEWHLTIGNPMKPIAMIGNLICKQATFEFGKVLGADDFPTELKVTVSLEHGRDRDKGDIESMFNYGQGRAYINSDGFEEPWNVGASTRNSENDLGNAGKLGDALVKNSSSSTVTDNTPTLKNKPKEDKIYGVSELSPIQEQPTIF